MNFYRTIKIKSFSVKIADAFCTSSLGSIGFHLCDNVMALVRGCICYRNFPARCQSTKAMIRIISQFTNFHSAGLDIYGIEIRQIIHKEMHRTHCHLDSTSKPTSCFNFPLCPYSPSKHNLVPHFKPVEQAAVRTFIRQQFNVFFRLVFFNPEIVADSDVVPSYLQRGVHCRPSNLWCRHALHYLQKATQLLFLWKIVLAGPAYQFPSFIPNRHLRFTQQATEAFVERIHFVDFLGFVFF